MLVLFVRVCVCVFWGGAIQRCVFSNYMVLCNMCITIRCWYQRAVYTTATIHITTNIPLGAMESTTLADRTTLAAMEGAAYPGSAAPLIYISPSYIYPPHICVMYTSTTTSNPLPRHKPLPPSLIPHHDPLIMLHPRTLFPQALKQRSGQIALPKRRDHHHHQLVFVFCSRSDL